jgi:hypothetical protein
MNFEHRGQKLISRRRFIHRLGRHTAAGSILILVSDVVGTLGYHHFASFSWVDSFLNASMLLGGMGPIGDLPNDASKLFASVFALYSGLVLILVAGVVLAPVFHRVLHRFHLDGK